MLLPATSSALLPVSAPSSTMTSAFAFAMFPETAVLSAAAATTVMTMLRLLALPVTTTAAALRLALGLPALLLMSTPVLLVPAAIAI